MGPAVILTIMAATAEVPDPMHPCLPGQERVAKAPSHCCWAGQTWDNARSVCTAAPRCPASAAAFENVCVVTHPAIAMTELAGGTLTTGDRGPGHPSTVTVSPFSIDQTEVTVDAYVACVARGTGTCTKPRPGSCCNYGAAERGNDPINCVDWDQADAYCRAQGKRLPTEDEWEWAATGGHEGLWFPWGNDGPGDRACLNHKAGTCPVGSYPSGDAPGGIHDMVGNVTEWTASTGRPDGREHVYRGGAWDHVTSTYVRVTVRRSDEPSYQDARLGFRCAR